jgi:hypothetical protein
MTVTAVVVSWPPDAAPRRLAGVLRTDGGLCLSVDRDALLAGTGGSLATPFLHEKVAVVAQAADGTVTEIRPIKWSMTP